MDTALISEVKDVGIGFGSLILFAVLFWQQMRLMEKFNKTIDNNTAATNALTVKIEQSMIVDQNVTSVIDKCRLIQQRR